MSVVSRRGFIGGTAATVGAAGGFLAGRSVLRGDEPAAATPRSHALCGEHQPGITTEAQDRLHMVAFDVITDSRDELVAMLQAWTAAADRMMRGEGAGPVGPVDGAYDAPPDDTGEAIGLPSSRLTITVGFGPGLFRDAGGRDRFGLADRRPAALRDLPHFPGDVLDPATCGGDLCVQACADDPQVAVHAIRNLARIGFGTVSVRWSQLGFGRTSSTTAGQDTPRNLFGFKDGTMNILADETDELARHVWVDPADDPAAGWLAGGSYLVARRIAMTIEVWDRQPLGDQERFIGRTKGSGAPLSGGQEFDEPDFDRQGSDGPLMPVDSHVRVVHPDLNQGHRLLRRGYNFVDGSNAVGGLDAGLFFIAFVRDPQRQFVPMQTAMATNDALMEYLRFTSSAMFACPPGVSGPDDWFGSALFA
ncbi:MAG: iron uptake transporter deferrochelatase/peroxidase subunit [Nocardioidaceae bacterium]